MGVKKDSLNMAKIMNTPDDLAPVRLGAPKVSNRKI
jgi:hypothetical protein